MIHHTITQDAILLFMAIIAVLLAYVAWQVTTASPRSSHTAARRKPSRPNTPKENGNKTLPRKKP